MAGRRRLKALNVDYRQSPMAPKGWIDGIKTKITRPAFEGMWLSLQDSFCRFQTTLWFAPVVMSEEEWRPIFGLTVYLLPHYDSHPAPWAQQAFTCCADLNGGSALFFGWSECYIRLTSIYAFIQKSLKSITIFVSSHHTLIRYSRSLVCFSIKISTSVVPISHVYRLIHMFP